MKTVNALEVRQSLGRVLDDLDSSNEPILVEKGRQPRAVLVSLQLFRERFADQVVHAERLALEDRIRAIRAGVSAGATAEVEVRGLRGELG